MIPKRFFYKGMPSTKSTTQSDDTNNVGAGERRALGLNPRTQARRDPVCLGSDSVSMTGCSVSMNFDSLSMKVDSVSMTGYSV